MSPSKISCGHQKENRPPNLIKTNLTKQLQKI